MARGDAERRNKRKDKKRDKKKHPYKKGGWQRVMNITKSDEGSGKKKKSEKKK